MDRENCPGTGGAQQHEYGDPALRLQTSHKGGGVIGRRDGSTKVIDRSQNPTRPRNTGEQTYIAWVKGHKDIKGNEMADKISKHASILGHESEGAVTPAGLRAWARRVRVEAR